MGDDMTATAADETGIGNGCPVDAVVEPQAWVAVSPCTGLDGRPDGFGDCTAAAREAR